MSALVGAISSFQVLSLVGMGSAAVLVSLAACWLALWTWTRSSVEAFRRTLSVPLKAAAPREALPDHRVTPSLSEDRPASVLKPGDHFVRSFQPSEGSASASFPPLLGGGASRCRVLAWNLERGLELGRILPELKRLGAEVLLLQELDAYCSRTGDLDVASTIAEALGMQVAWACEFEEVSSPAREALPAKRVGPGRGHSHGNAILIPPLRSGARFVSTWSFLHAHQPFDWAANGGKGYAEPRVGGRVCLGAHVRLPVATPPGQQQEPGQAPLFHELLVYSLHLENNGGPMGRWLQFAEAAADAMERKARVMDQRGRSRSEGCATSGDGQGLGQGQGQGLAARASVPVVIGGDLNTLCSGVARLLPGHVDGWALRQWPWTHEAEAWRSQLLPTLEAKGLETQTGRSEGGKGLSLRDPFPSKGPGGATATAARGLFEAKLDWLLVEAGAGMPVVVSKACGGVGDAGISDHAWLSVDLAVVGSQMR